MIGRSSLFLSWFILGSIAVGTSARAEDGIAAYNTSCSVCHQAQGAGSPGQFPPLKGRVSKIAATAEGRTYIIHVILNGLHGTINAAGASYTGFMPSFRAQSDAQLAALLSYITSLDTPDASLFTVEAIKAERAAPKKAKEILAERKALNDAHPLP